ncbi:hypothetical protein IWQ61_007628 [Dispira simplex]|nr:hypothetical protein IWQ61_007628 [Dispira simplex]
MDPAKQQISLTTYHTHSGTQLEVDWLVSAVDAVQVQTQFMDSLLLPHALDVFHPKTHALRVLPTMQLAHLDYPHIFVLGDATNFPCTKTAYHSGIQGGIAGENLAQLIKHSKVKGQNLLLWKSEATVRKPVGI